MDQLFQGQSLSYEWSCICHQISSILHLWTLHIIWFCTLNLLDNFFSINVNHVRICISFCRDRIHFIRIFCIIDFFICWVVGINVCDRKMVSWDYVSNLWEILRHLWMWERDFPYWNIWHEDERWYLFKQSVCVWMT